MARHNRPESPSNDEQAFTEVLQRARVLDWLYGVVAVFCAIAIVLSILRPQSYAQPWVGSALAGIVLLTSVVLLKTAWGRTAKGLVSLFLLIYASVIGLAHFNGLGLRTPVLSIGPILLFLTACLVPWRVSLGICAVAVLMVLSLVPATPVVSGPGMPTLFAEAQSAVLNFALVSLLGMAVGRLLRTSISESLRAARTRYRSFYSEQSFETLQAVLQASPYCIVMLEIPSGRVRLFNAAFAQIVGRSVEEIERHTGQGLGSWADTEQRNRVIASAMAGQSVQDRFAVRRTDGTVRTIEGSAKPVEIDGIRHVLLVGHDISDEAQRQAELQAVIDTAEAAIVVVRRGVILLASRRYDELMGYPAEGAVGQSVEQAVGGGSVVQDLQSRHSGDLRAGRAVSFEQRILRRDGSPFEARVTARLVNPGGHDGFTLVALVEDITAANAQRLQLEKAREDALAASQAKSEFLAAMSHEIRTPLNGVMGLAELAADAQLDAATRAEYLRLIVESGRSLSQVISDVLDLSKIEAGRLELKPEDFDLTHWLQGIRDTYAWQIEAKGLQWVVESPAPGLGWVRADPVRLRQIVVNYVSNALKFTFGGEIRLVLSWTPAGRLRIEVRDTGMGIDAATQQQLFRPYSQATLSPSAFGGTGLGLSICRELAQRMGGKVGVSSEPGVGSTFWAEVTVEVRTAPQPRTEAVPTEPSLPLMGLRVLLVDDNRINRVVGERLLQRAGALVQTAEDGLCGVQVFEKAQHADQPFDVVLMDIQMPVMDGLEATRLIRQGQGGQAVSIVAATAAVTEDEVSQALAQGMDGLVSKPFDSSRLISGLLQARQRRARPLPLHHDGPSGVGF